MTEELRCDQRWRDSGAIDTDECPGRTLRPLVYGPGNQLLPVPVSPVNNTVESVGATLATRASTA